MSIGMWPQKKPICRHVIGRLGSKFPVSSSALGPWNSRTVIREKELRHQGTRETNYPSKERWRGYSKLGFRLSTLARILIHYIGRISAERARKSETSVWLLLMRLQGVYADKRQATGLIDRGGLHRRLSQLGLRFCLTSTSIKFLVSQYRSLISLALCGSPAMGRR